MIQKMKWTPIYACVAAAIIVVAFTFSGLISKQILVDEYKLKVHELLKEAIQDFKEIRGFPLEDVEVEVVTISWAKEKWGEALAEANKEQIMIEERIYKGLFMIPEDISLYNVEVEWSGMIAAAVWQGKIYIVKEYFNPSEFYAKRMLIHELTHIMQSKYFALEERGLFDGEKAKSALIEGDARLMEEAYTNKTRESFAKTETAKTESLTTHYGKILSNKITAALPDSISRLFAFPYEYGLEFVKTLYGKGGWDAVNKAYSNAPTTTEQIMHPEKYFINETGKKATTPEPALENWREMKSDSYGEYFILVMFQNWIPESEAVTAAEGWGGDNLTYYENGEDYVFTWEILWDSAGDALEFAVSFQNMVEKAGANKMGVNLWYTNEKFLSLTLKDEKTLVISSTSEVGIKDFISFFEGDLL